MSLIDILEVVGYILDTPGSHLRGIMSGRPGERTSGREMLESWGALGANQEGLDFGDVAGFGADLLADPLNLLGGLGIVRKAAQVSSVRGANRASEVMRATGFMPEEIADVTKHFGYVGQGGMGLKPGVKTMFHGTPDASVLNARQLDLEHFGLRDAGYRGKGIYFTPDEGLARETYAGEAGSVVDAYLDIRNPYINEIDGPWSMVERLEAMGEQVAPLADEITSADSIRISEQFTEALRRLGHDSIIDIEGEHLVFDPSQIYRASIAPARQKIPKQSRTLMSMLLANNLSKPYAP